jgi:hypothetical protein
VLLSKPRATRVTTVHSIGTLMADETNHTAVTNTARTPLYQSQARLTGGRDRSSQTPFAKRLADIVGVKPSQLHYNPAMGMREGWRTVLADGSTRPVGTALVDRAIASMIE